MKSKLIIDEIGTKYWYNPNGYYHREDGPAIEYSDGDKYWYIDDELHREDGAAIEFSNGYKAWWINGVSYTEQQYKYETRSIKLKLLL